MVDVVAQIVQNVVAAQVFSAPSFAPLEIPFSWGDATPKLLALVATGKLVSEVSIILTTTFNGVGATLAIGSTGSPPEDLMARAQNDPAALATYRTNPNKVYGVATNIYLTIAPGAGASQGAGLVKLVIQQ